MTATFLAPAKVNLWLRVLGRRADGFHELDTGMLALDLADELEVEPRAEPGIELAVEGPFASPDVPRDERNLAWRAARLALDGQARAGSDVRVDINVDLAQAVDGLLGKGRVQLVRM